MLRWRMSPSPAWPSSQSMTSSETLGFCCLGCDQAEHLPTPVTMFKNAKMTACWSDHLCGRGMRMLQPAAAGGVRSLSLGIMKPATCSPRSGQKRIERLHQLIDHIVFKLETGPLKLKSKLRGTSFHPAKECQPDGRVTDQATQRSLLSPILDLCFSRTSNNVPPLKTVQYSRRSC